MQPSVNSSPQLWPFLLDLLTSSEYKHLIRWVGDDGEFEFVMPELVAQMWGLKKGNENMNFSKLSRALRSYYSNGIISKVNGQQYIYKFEFDLGVHLGYSVEELRRLLKY